MSARGRGWACWSRAAAATCRRCSTRARSADFPAEVALVVSNVPTAFALERARKAGVPAVVLDHKALRARGRTSSRRWWRRCAPAGVEWVCLAGFMRLLGADFLRRFPGRVLNIHPSLLPAFPGLHAQRQALERGVKVAGCTVHFVDAGTDTGPIIAQAAVPVLPGDDEAALAARILDGGAPALPAGGAAGGDGRGALEGRARGVDARAGRGRAEPAQPGGAR